MVYYILERKGKEAICMEPRRCYGCMNMVEEEICPHCSHSANQHNQPHQLPAGTILKNQYQVGKVLGQGGFGITYIGMDISLDMVVAIKEFYPASAVNRDSAYSLKVQLNTEEARKHYRENQERFLREAQVLAKMQHVPEIVGVRGFFEDNNTAYIVMDFVRGMDLRSFVRQQGGKVPADVLLPLMEPVMRALDTVHKAGLVHRDISPDNIMLLPDGNIKILDFGAVRAYDSLDSEVDLTHSTEAILKHGFAPMEQYRSRGSLGPWTDQYGLCASIYYCLTGRVPPDAPARAMGEEDVNWDVVPGLTALQRQVLNKGMAMLAKNRFANMEELRAALYDGKYAVQEAPAPVPPKPDPKPAKPKKHGWLVAVLLLAALGAGAFFLKDRLPGISMEAPPAETIPVETTLPTESTIPPVSIPEETEAPETQPEETLPPETVTVQVKAWEKNLAKKNPMDDLGLERSQIYGVTFLGSTETAPWNALDASYAGDGSVLVWKEWKNHVNLKVAHVYIAADGGINGRYACEELFKDCINLEEVSFGTNFHTDQAESMAYMFYNCYNLTTPPLAQFETQNVKDMQYMFALKNAYSWDSLNVQYLDTSSVENMSHMFAGRSGTYSINVNNWDMRNVRDISGMFKDCKNLNSASVGSWDLQSLENMSEVFSGCQDLKNCDVRNWNVSKVKDMSSAFFYCIFLEYLDVADWDVSSAENMSNLFCGCIKLKKLDVENWNVSNVKDVTAMFSNCEVLEQPDVTKWDVSNVTAYDRFFDGNALINGNFWKYFFES